ncbi:MAG: hypothetical protein CSA70_07195 [Rhodobacterales bacterium]|nr:MAG: hypothetical protein CSA70_07195 [Rhodobacterales bacterium]
MKFLANLPLAITATRAQSVLTQKVRHKGQPGTSAANALAEDPMTTRVKGRAKRAGTGTADWDLSQGLTEHLSSLLDTHLILPLIEDPEAEITRAGLMDKGQFLARQDRWDEISDLIRAADSTRALTPCGMSHATLLATGARADVVSATAQAIEDGVNPSLAGIEALEELICEYPDDYVIAAIVAQAHADIGWAWRGHDWSHEIPERNLALFHAHFARAEQILNQLQRRGEIPDDSPLIAATRCLLATATDATGQVSPPARLADDYARLIDLDPLNPRHMRALGNHLLPRWFGSYDALELEARRTAARTRDQWGNGAYAWVYFDALAVDLGATRMLDVEFFTDGMRDILAARPDQHIANLFAAYAAITMGPDRTPLNAPDMLRATRATIHDCLDWVLGEYLHELHPLVWAEASLGPGLSGVIPQRKALIRKGVDAARLSIARHFEQDLRAGATVAFSRHGLRLYPSGPQT